MIPGLHGVENRSIIHNVAVKEILILHWLTVRIPMGGAEMIFVSPLLTHGSGEIDVCLLLCFEGQFVRSGSS
jgi:hypothetical protein